ARPPTPPRRTYPAAAAAADRHLDAGPVRPGRTRRTSSPGPDVELDPGRSPTPPRQDVLRATARPVRRAGPVRAAVGLRRQGLPGLAALRPGRRPVRLRAGHDPRRRPG